jgi:hypothetical protein
MSQANHQDGAWYQIVNSFTNTMGKGFFIFLFFLFLLGPPKNLTLQNWNFFVGKTHLIFLFFGQKIAK